MTKMCGDDEAGASQMLGDIGLANLHVRLCRAGPDTPVTDITFDLGFTHLSRVARRRWDGG